MEAEGAAAGAAEEPWQVELLLASAGAAWPAAAAGWCLLLSALASAGAAGAALGAAGAAGWMHLAVLAVAPNLLGFLQAAAWGAVLSFLLQEGSRAGAPVLASAAVLGVQEA